MEQGAVNSSAGNYRLVLRQEYHARKSRNPAYSLRAFARSLGVSHSGLSQVLSGKRPLAAKTAQKIGRSLGWSAERTRLNLGISEKPRRGFSRAGIDDFRELEAETFEAIASWQYYVILSLLELPQEKPLSDWVARRLGISRAEARRAISRLARLGIIERRGGRWRQTGQRLTTTQDVASFALRSYYKENLRRAESALDEVPLLERDFSSVTMAIDPAQLSLAKAEIKKFRRRMNKLMETPHPRRVYTLTIQLFPADREDSARSRS